MLRDLEPQATVARRYMVAISTKGIAMNKDLDLLIPHLEIPDSFNLSLT